MACHRIGPAIVCVAPVHTLDVGGRRVTFELLRYCGPVLLRADGEPRRRQPGPRSPFWPAFERWQQTHDERPSAAEET